LLNDTNNDIRKAVPALRRLFSERALLFLEPGRGVGILFPYERIDYELVARQAVKTIRSGLDRSAAEFSLEARHLSKTP
jgi:hypothetical protein